MAVAGAGTLSGGFDQLVIGLHRRQQHQLDANNFAEFTGLSAVAGADPALEQAMADFKARWLGE